MIKCAYHNILELSVVSLSAGAEDALYPLYRLYDRNIGRPFRTTSAVTTEIKIDQGGSPVAVDRLLIPDGHNLSGMTLDIKYSDDDLTYTPAVPQWTGASGLINKKWTEASHRYWKFIITNPSSIPQIPELWLTFTYTWERNPVRPAGPFDQVFNVERAESSSGTVRYLIKGAPRRQRVYKANTSQKNNIIALNDAWAGGRPFWLFDHDGNWIFGELRRGIRLIETAYGRYDFDFDFLEVLP